MKDTFDKLSDRMKYIQSNEKVPLDLIRIPKYSRKDVDIPARILTHWDKMDLLIKKNVTGATFSFSLIESFWLKIIQKLRAYNIPLELIKQLKEELCHVQNAAEIAKFNPDTADILSSIDKSLTKNEIEELLLSSEYLDFIQKTKPTQLENILLDIILTRSDLRVLIDENGVVVLFCEGRILSDKIYNEKLTEILSKTHLNIALFDIIKDLIKFLGEDECSASHNILSKDEAEVLKHLRQDDVSRIEIIFDKVKGDIETIKVTKKSSVTNFSRIQDLILRNGYQDITIKTQNGIVAHCESTTKYKLDTE